MKKHLLTSVALLALLGGSAMAADMPIKAPPAPVYIYSWTGCYIGGNAGWIGGGDRLTNYPGPGVVAFSGLTGADVHALTNSVVPRGSGFAGGGQVGCNWMAAGTPFVLGLEADFNGSSLKESETATYLDTFITGGGFFPRHTEVNTKDVTWFSTFRGRFGLAADRWFLYGTGGLAVAHINSSFNRLSITGVLFSAGSDSQTRTGWTVGGGLEYAFADSWTVRAEYLYLDFGTYTFASPTVGIANFDWATDVRAREHIVRVGLNYKFGGPVVAKY